MDFTLAAFQANLPADKADDAYALAAQAFSDANADASGREVTFVARGEYVMVQITGTVAGNAFKWTERVPAT